MRWNKKKDKKNQKISLTKLAKGVEKLQQEAGYKGSVHVDSKYISNSANENDVPRIQLSACVFCGGAIIAHALYANTPEELYRSIEKQLLTRLASVGSVDEVQIEL